MARMLGLAAERPVQPARRYSSLAALQLRGWAHLLRREHRPSEADSKVAHNMLRAVQLQAAAGLQGRRAGRAQGAAAAWKSGLGNRRIICC